MNDGLNPAFAAKLGQRAAKQSSDPGGERPCVLIVDDEPEITTTVSQLLADEFVVLTATTVDEALAQLQAHEVAVILTDQRMPHATGVELLAQALDISPETTRILFTGYSDISAVIDAVNDGQVYRYVTKPWRVEELRLIVKQGFERYELALQNRRLLKEIQRVNEELAAANVELREFAYSLAHDLRAPLRALDGFSYAIMEDYADRLDAAGQDYLVCIRTASQRMADLFDAQSALFVSGHLPLEPVEVDVTALARELVKQKRRADGQRVVEVTVADGMYALTDPAVARLVLERLLDNAWKFTSVKDVAHVEVGCVDDGGETVFFVRDDGVGFDPAFAEKLFTPFERLHAQDEFEGLGIGLATVRRMLDRLGGRCWAIGECDRGAVVWFTLAAKE